MKKVYIFVFIHVLCVLPQLCFSQINKVTFDQLDSLQMMEKRPVVVFLYTSWCKYCGAMKNTTLKNHEVIQVLSKKYHFISFDIEEKKEIHFHGHTFRYKPTGANTGINELSEQLATVNGNIAFPAICILNADYEIIHQQEGFVSSKQLLYILNRLLLKK